MKSLIQIKYVNWYLFFTDVKNSLSWVTLRRQLSIGVFVVYIDTGSPMPNIPSKSRGLADENKKFLTEWKWFETSVLKHYCSKMVIDVPFGIVLLKRERRNILGNQYVKHKNEKFILAFCIFILFW